MARMERTETFQASTMPIRSTYRQARSGATTIPSRQLLRAVAELLETEPDTILAEMGYVPHTANFVTEDEAGMVW